VEGKDAHGNVVKFLQVGGRTTAYVPALQIKRTAIPTAVVPTTKAGTSGEATQTVSALAAETSVGDPKKRGNNKGGSMKRKHKAGQNGSAQDARGGMKDNVALDRAHDSDATRQAATVSDECHAVETTVETPKKRGCSKDTGSGKEVSKQRKHRASQKKASHNSMGDIKEDASSPDRARDSNGTRQAATVSDAVHTQPVSRKREQEESPAERPQLTAQSEASSSGGVGHEVGNGAVTGEEKGGWVTAMFGGRYKTGPGRGPGPRERLEPRAAAVVARSRMLESGRASQRPRHANLFGAMMKI
jgi:hypothetical protein